MRASMPSTCESMTKLPTVVLRTLLVLSLFVAGLAPAAAQQPPQPPEGFVSVNELPPEEQFPAAPLVISAYAFVVLMLFGYMVLVARRLGAVQQDLERVESDLKKGTRA